MRRHFNDQLETVVCGTKRLGTLVPLFRILVPLIMLCLMLLNVHTVYISELNLEISSVAMYCIVIGVHMIATWCGIQNEAHHGWHYELSACFLATEVTLFIYFVENRFAAASFLALIYFAGLMWLSTYGRKQLRRSYRRRRIPQVLINDIIASGNGRITPLAAFSVALRRYLVIAPAVLLLIPSLMVIFNQDAGRIKQTGNKHAIISWSNDNQLMANLPTLALLEEPTWDQLDDQQKVDVLQVIADIESNYLAIPPVVVVNCDLENQVIGTYNHADRQIQIDLEGHEGYAPIEYVKTILHECRHAYQHDCVGSLDWDDPRTQIGIYFAQARQWCYDQQHYVSASENHEQYYNQSIEKDARQYAEEGVYVYRQYICLSSLPVR